MRNSKSQAPNIKQTTNLKRQKANNGKKFGPATGVFCALSFVCDWVLVPWNFGHPVSFGICEPAP
jgi:hypothetical protein